MKKLNELVNKYSYNIEYDQENNIFIGRCAELPSLTAHGDSQELAFKEIKMAVLETLKWMKEENEILPEAFSLHRYSGEFRVRMPPEKHRRIAIEANFQGVSMNQFIVSKL